MVTVNPLQPSILPSYRATGWSGRLSWTVPTKLPVLFCSVLFPPSPFWPTHSWLAASSINLPSILMQCSRGRLLNWMHIRLTPLQLSTPPRPWGCRRRAVRGAPEMLLSIDEEGDGVEGEISEFKGNATRKSKGERCSPTPSLPALCLCVAWKRGGISHSAAPSDADSHCWPHWLPRALWSAPLSTWLGISSRY